MLQSSFLSLLVGIRIPKTTLTICNALPVEKYEYGSFVFKRVDLAADSEPIDTFWKQVNDLKSKRDSFEELEALETLKYDDKTVTSITHLGEKDSSRYCYRFSLIEFKADNTKFAVVLQVALPGEWEKSKPILAEIIGAARPLPDQR